jgi:hypothetical protein
MSETVRLDPQCVLLDSFSALSDAIDRLLPLAQHRIAVFDVSLSDVRWNSTVRFDALYKLLLASRTNQLQIVLHHTDSVARLHPRLMILLQQFSDRMEIRRCSEEAMRIFDPFVVVDEQHYVHQFHHERMRAELGVAQPQKGRDLSFRFEELWRAAEPGLAASVLGL